jgi:hypothetical protein
MCGKGVEKAIPLIYALNQKLGRQKEYNIYWVYNDLGKAYLARNRSGDLDLAVNVLSEVITKSPNSVAYATRALAYQRLVLL